jgi:hypothetical protein
LVSRLELALEEDVADHAALTRDRVVGQKIDSRELGPGAVPVEAPEELVAAADGEEGGTVSDLLAQRLSLASKIGRDESLLAILATADVVEVVLSGADSVSEPDRPVVEADPAPGGTALQDRDIAPVGIDVQVIGIEVSDDDLRLHAASSQ